MSDIHKIILDGISQPLWDSWYIKEETGRGASSVVYRIEAQREQRTDISALKIEPIILDESVYVDEKQRAAALERKRQEAVNETTIMYKLRKSPYIVWYEDESIKPLVHDGKELGYYLMIRMEYLKCVHKMIRSNSFDLSEKNILKLAYDIGSGIKAAHDMGVIHRDIKPGNFFVAEDGTYKLGDFNISKKTVSSHSFAGTEGYIAPEIYRAKYSKDQPYTKQADIYSFGISLYCMMNDLWFPFGESCLPEEAIERRMSGEPLTIPKNASPEFGRIILKACAFNQADRYQSMDDMLNELNAYINGSNNRAIAGQTVGAGSAAIIRQNNGSGHVNQTSEADKINPVQPVSIYNQPSMQSFNNFGQQYPQGFNDFYGATEKKKSSQILKIILALMTIILTGLLILLIFIALNQDSDSDRGKNSDIVTEYESGRTDASDENVENETIGKSTGPTDETTSEITSETTTEPDNTVELDKYAIELEVGETDEIIPLRCPESERIWLSDNESIATVDSSGKITAVGPGSCCITLKFKDNPIAEAQVRVLVTETVQSVDFRKNGSANIINGGYACTDGTSIFYSHDHIIYEYFSGILRAGSTAYYINTYGDYIYFCDSDNGNSICSMKKDGSEYKVIYNSYCYELTLYKDWLYFSDLSGDVHNICRMRIDGTGYERLASVNCWYMSVYDDKIYFVDYDNDFSLDIMNLDGSGRTTLVSSGASDICISDGKIYYSADRETRNLYSMNPDGSQKTLLRNSYTKHTNICGDRIYCTNYSGNMTVLDLSGRTLETYSEFGVVSYPVVMGDILFLNDENGELVMLHDE